MLHENEHKMSIQRNQYKKTIKNSKLREWMIILETKEWKSIIDIAEAKFIYIVPASMDAIKHFYKYNKKFKQIIESTKRGEIFEYKSYCDIIKMQVSQKEWFNISSEVPKICSLYKKMQIIQHQDLNVNLDLQRFFLDNNMRKNLESINKSNQKEIKNSQIDHVYHNVITAKNIELQLEDVRNKNNRKKTLNQHEDIPTLDTYLESVELFYHENKLRILCEKICFSSFGNPYNLKDDELDFIKNIPQKYIDIPQNKLFLLSINILINKDENIYNELVDYLNNKEIQKAFTTKYLSFFYNYLIVFCTVQMNDGKTFYQKEFLKYIDIISSNNLLLEQGEIPTWRFKNIIKVALKENHLDWVENFIIKYEDSLELKDKEITLAYCQSLLLFRQKRYEEAFVKLFNKDLARDTLIKIDYQFLLLHIALNMKEMPIDFIRYKENLRGVINTKENISDDVKDKWRLAVNWIGKVQDATDHSSRKSLGEDIKKEGYFLGKEWLLAYINKKN